MRVVFKYIFKLGYICSCLSGHQIAGCCVHVATVIYYLSYAKGIIEKDPQNQKYPSKHLKSILINIQKSEKPNEPDYIRQKRRKSIFVQKESSSQSSDCSSGISSDDETQKNKVITPKKK